MSERGTYGQPSQSSLGKWLAAGVVAGAAVLLYRNVTKHQRTLATTLDAFRAEHSGLKSGPSQTEQDAYWDAHYAKRGLKLTAQGDLVPMKGEHR